MSNKIIKLDADVSISGNLTVDGKSLGLEAGEGINITDGTISVDNSLFNYDNYIVFDGLLKNITYPSTEGSSLLWSGDTTNRYNVGAYANLDAETGVSKAAPTAPIAQEGSLYDGRTVLRLVYPEEGNDKTSAQIYIKKINLGIGSIKGTIAVSKENNFTDATSLSIWGYINGKGYKSIAVLTDKLNEIETTNEYFPLEFTFNNSVDTDYKAIMITYKATSQNNTIRVAELDLVTQNLTTDDRNKLNKLNITGESNKFLAADGKYRDTEVSMECVINTLAPNATKTIDLTTTGANLVDWGDGTISSTLSHTYIEDGIYTIKIYGTNDIKSTFKSNYSLIQVRILNNIKTISQSAFRGAKNLTNVYIGNCVNLISDIAFDGTSSVPTIVFESAVPPTLGTIVSDTSGARHFNKSSKLIVPMNSVDAYKAAFDKFSDGIDSYTTETYVNAAHAWKTATFIENLWGDRQGFEIPDNTTDFYIRSTTEEPAYDYVSNPYTCYVRNPVIFGVCRSDLLSQGTAVPISVEVVDFSNSEVSNIELDIYYQGDTFYIIDSGRSPRTINQLGKPVVRYRSI